MKTKRLIIVALLVVALLVIIVWSKGKDRREEGAMKLSGNIEVTEMNLSFKRPGKITLLLTEEGQSVKKGDKLAELDAEELGNQLRQYQAQVYESGFRLEELLAGSRPQEIEQARAAVGQAKAELVKAKADFDRAEELYANGAIAAEERDALRRAYLVTVAQLKRSTEALSLVREGPRREEIQAIRMRLQQAKAALAASENRLRDSYLFAPSNGVVLKKTAELGETLATGVPVYKIGDVANPWVKVYIKEDKLGLVKLGQSASVTTDSYPGKVYKGAVTYIASEAEFTPKNVQTEEERVKLVFGLKVSVENPAGELKPGMPADVRIALR
ncbi:efflux RND transporter periplasmic adaptor subunit [Syntrophus aciditrophicus]|uniref:Periplasmic component of efflux system n=1 Tax=Syntrophus aciditrophicus (strain SB) TaxID=56780 RepID=Q2LXA7_SYNAS|nr:efflux RND transporter periplasmic adaptor subunit [Syntrophus aciditrophicus]ABC78715.1 periplasmic component of efflux system [Syntrophus aciditrophicus SB]